jgi:3-deoxy-7-phosphoheptulonate synthase
MSSQSIFTFATATSAANLANWMQYFDSNGTTAVLQRLGETPVIIATGPGADTTAPDSLVRPVAKVSVTGDFRLGRRELRPEGTVVRIGNATVGDGSLNVFAGPCAVENRQQMLACANVAAHYGAIGLRGGAFKPRTSPYSFQGLKWAGLDLLAEAREHTGLPILTEALDPRHVERLAATVDGLQIGARNMQNFELLTEAGKSGLPVVLKRGFGCTIDETLAAAEYIMAEGNDQVILCERGIRTFEKATRFTLDLSAAVLMKQRSHLPVMVDPSHSVGIPALVAPMSLAAAAAGVDALLIDVHVAPEQALCDGKQALLPDDFGMLMGNLELLAMGLSRKMAGVVRPALADAEL